MAVTRRVYAVTPRLARAPQLPCDDGRQYAQVFTDPAVNALMDTFAPAERIVNVTHVGNQLYIFTESFGLGPAKRKVL